MRIHLFPSLLSLCLHGVVVCAFVKDYNGGSDHFDQKGKPCLFVEVSFPKKEPPKPILRVKSNQEKTVPYAYQFSLPEKPNNPVYLDFDKKTEIIKERKLPDRGGSTSDSYARITPNLQNPKPAYPKGYEDYGRIECLVTLSLKGDGTVQTINIHNPEKIPAPFKEELEKALIQWTFSISFAQKDWPLTVDVPICFVVDHV